MTVDNRKKLVCVPVCNDPVLEKDYLGREFLYYGYKNSIYVETSLNGLIAELTRLRETHRDRFQDIEIRTEMDCGCRHDCSCSPSHVLYGKRYETDLERDFRIVRETVRLVEKEKRERAEYEALKMKYGD